jgi:ABC-type sugar transport system substrate-binding protein
MRHGHGKKQRIRVKAKDTPGVICIERHTHDEAIVISGSLVVDYVAADLKAWIAQELEAAAREVGENGGIIGHIKTALGVTSTTMISVTDEKAMAKESPQKRARITLAAIVFKIDPEKAEDIIRKSLAAVRLRLRQEKVTTVPEVDHS